MYLYPRYLKNESSDCCETSRVLLLGWWDKLIKFWWICDQMPLTNSQNTKTALSSQQLRYWLEIWYAAALLGIYPTHIASRREYYIWQNCKKSYLSCNLLKISDQTLGHNSYNWGAISVPPERFCSSLNFVFLFKSSIFKGERARALDILYRHLYTPPAKIGVLGPTLSEACTVVSETAFYWNLTVVYLHPDTIFLNITLLKNHLNNV